MIGFLERVKDPQVDNWLGDLYINRRYPSLRSSLAGHQSYFGTHLLEAISMQSAEKAALVTLAVYHFKTTLESGKLEPQYLFGQQIDLSSYQWLFHTCRKPGLGSDKLRKYDRNDHNVVVRRDYIYNLILKGKTQSQHIIFGALETVHAKVIEDASRNTSWLSIFTTDNRGQCARVSW